MRHLAWLHASFDNGRGAKSSRLFDARKLGRKVNFPAVGCASYMLNIISRIGFPRPGESIPHSEIRAWCLQSGCELSPAEHDLVYRLLINYSSSRQEFEADVEIGPPHSMLTEEERIQNEAKRSILTLKPPKGVAR